MWKLPSISACNIWIVKCSNYIFDKMHLRYSILCKKYYNIVLFKIIDCAITGTTMIKITTRNHLHIKPILFSNFYCIILAF
ncbi:hypothetical protein APU20_16790 [Klebsiella variicola]|nr:hypothetical protein APU20_16790 [Klebsiella variicola]